MPITLRLVLLENLRRLADQIAFGHQHRHDADLLADRILGIDSVQPVQLTDVDACPNGDLLPEVFAAQLAKRLRDCDPLTTPAIAWLEKRLATQGTKVDLVVQHAQERQGASNVTVRNVITSLRTISEMDWQDLFEGVSLVDAKLREHPGFADMDFARPSRIFPATATTAKPR